MKHAPVKAYKIDAETRTVTELTVSNLEDMQRAVGGYIAHGVGFENGDTLFVDDEGLLKYNENFFLVSGANQPFAGNGLLVGAADEEGETLHVQTPIESVRALVSFVNRAELARHMGLN